MIFSYLILYQAGKFRVSFICRGKEEETNKNADPAKVFTYATPANLERHNFMLDKVAGRYFIPVMPTVLVRRGSLCVCIFYLSNHVQRHVYFYDIVEKNLYT
jgi:hypothetical protein